MPAGESSRRKYRHGPHLTITPQEEARLRQLRAEHPSASLKYIAQAMGNIVSHETIRAWCIKLNLPRRMKRGQQSRLTPEIELRLRSLKAERPYAGYKEFATELNQPFQTVLEWINRLGLPLRCEKCHRTKMTTAMVNRLVDFKARWPQASYKKIAAELGVSILTARSWVKRLGLPHQTVKAMEWAERIKRQNGNMKLKTRPCLKQQAGVNSCLL